MPRADLFTIGEFSAITGVGIHSLRYYDEIGALKPEYVDPVSNYRYYGLRQLGLIPAIELCKDAGISLSNFDSFIVDGGVDYNKLLTESRYSLERKIDSYRLKQREIDQTGMLLSIEAALRNNKDITLYLDSINVWMTPIDDVPESKKTFSSLLRKVSSDAHRHGKRITASACGITQKCNNGKSGLYAFSQVSGEAGQVSGAGQVDESSRKVELPSGNYLIRPAESFSIEAAQAVFSDVPEAANSDTVFALAFICDGDYPLFCAAARVS